MKKTEGVGGLDYNPNTKDVDLFGIRKIRLISKEGAELENLRYFIGIPGKTMGHSLWRLSVHFKEKLNEIIAFTIEKYNKEKLGQEGAVRVIFWLSKLNEGKE